MPSVGMRRTTRVFGARVLRSGRRLWSEPPEAKRRKAAASDGEEWIDILDGSGDGGGGDCGIHVKENRWRSNVDEKKENPQLGRNVGGGLVSHGSHGDRKWGSVYLRRRKRKDSKSFHFDGGKKRCLEDRKYGKHFIRKQWRNKKIRESCPCPVAGISTGRVLNAVIESCTSSSSSWFAGFLSSVLRYMRSAGLSLVQLYAFLSSASFAHVFSSNGIRFLMDSPSIKTFGIWEIFGAWCSVPLFSVNFSAVPFCFMYLHCTLLLRSIRFSYVLLMHSNVEEDRETEVPENLSCLSSKRDFPENEMIMSGMSNDLHPAIGASKFAGRTVNLRNGVNSRRIQKRSISLRSRRKKNPSALHGRKAKGAWISTLFTSKPDGIPFVPVSFGRQLRSSVRKNSTPNIKVLKSSLVGLTEDVGSMSCSANVLVVESDKCYRIKGAIIMLEISSSKQWILAVKKDGLTLYSLSAQKVMRPCSTNRVTHDIIWTEDIKNWKLEFLDRQEWLIFKELYRACSDRNVKAPTSEVIPVPGVREVVGYADSVYVPFRQPSSYISVEDDELSRALAKRAANYDMDSEDEEWLRKFNKGSFGVNEQWEHISEECFELIVDAFEKTFYCSPDDCSGEETAGNLCLDIARKEVVEAMYSYWMKKRKQKDSALVRVFQCYQPRRAQLLPMPIIRKKRSFKRQASYSVRGEQRTFRQGTAVATKQDAMDEQNALHKAEETKATASRCEGLAVVKRRRAQLLMETADLAAYKAAMVLRIAEAARVAESADAAASFFLY